jgi:VCBS repeat-containing protein
VGGSTKTLKVPLVASAKQALKAGKSLKVTITATVRDGAGNTRVTTKPATLKPPA